jgi:hypothetical protein
VVIEKPVRTYCQAVCYRAMVEFGTEQGAAKMAPEITVKE